MTTTASPLRAYVDQYQDLPADVLLGRLVLFTITEERVRRDNLVAWFDELGLDAALLPMADSAVNSYKKATSDTKDSFPLSKGRMGYVLCRDVKANDDYIRRQITREIKDAEHSQLAYHAAITCTFHRARTEDQKSARLQITVHEAHLGRDELPFIRQIARDIHSRYEGYLDYVDAQKVRRMIRGYLKKLNAIEIKGGVYFVHVSRDDELSRLAELVNRLGGDCLMHTFPLPDLHRERAFIVRTFEREAAQTLSDLTKEINEITGSRESVTPATFNRLNARFKEVARNAEEHMLTLHISQDSTAAAAEVAQNALAELADRMVSDD